MDNPEADKEFFKKIQESLDKQMWHQLNYGTWVPPEQSVSFSTASSEPAKSPINRDMILEMMRDLRERDPLLRRGIEKDWVCVVPPALVAPLKQYIKDHPPTHYVSSLDELQDFLGRRVFVINDAPSDKVEYMQELTMRTKYAEHFLREIEMLKMWQEENKDEPPTD